MSEFKPDISQRNGCAQFPTPEVLQRPWGEEVILFKVPGAYTFKLLKYKKGQKGGLQYHHKKDEGGYVVSGQMLVRYDNGNGKLSEIICNPGDVVHFPQGAVHQEEALSDLVVIEVSTAYMKDRVRVEELYGLPKGEGLPTTLPEEVEAV